MLNIILSLRIYTARCIGVSAGENESCPVEELVEEIASLSDEASKSAFNAA